MTQNIAIFYHIFQSNYWETLFNRQICVLQQSGLYDAAKYIHFGVNGSLPLTYDATKINVVKRNLNWDFVEADTLTDLYNFSVKNPDYKILYFHTKGVSYPEGHPGQTSWLAYLEFFNIKKWRMCIDLLNVFDCVGTEWSTTHPNDKNIKIPPCYGGNFWWANAKYIARLDPNYLYKIIDDPQLQSTGIQVRHSSEFWIGSGNPSYFNFYSTNKNKYAFSIPPEEYINLYN